MTNFIYLYKYACKRGKPTTESSILKQNLSFIPLIVDSRVLIFFNTNNYLPKPKKRETLCHFPVEQTMGFPFPLVACPSDNLTSYWKILLNLGGMVHLNPTLPFTTPHPNK